MNDTKLIHWNTALKMLLETSAKKLRFHNRGTCGTYGGWVFSDDENRIEITADVCSITGKLEWIKICEYSSAPFGQTNIRYYFFNGKQLNTHRAKLDKVLANLFFQFAGVDPVDEFTRRAKLALGRHYFDYHYSC